jgi:hypothetical protein
MRVLRVWEVWSLYAPTTLLELEGAFLGTEVVSTGGGEDAVAEAAEAMEEEDLDGDPSLRGVGG